MQTNNSTSSDLFIIGVGSSAGGLEALQEFLSHLPSQLDNFAIIIAQHLSPTYKSLLDQLLGRETHLQVVKAENNMFLESGKVYITPPDSDITIHNNFIHLTKPKSSIGPKPSVDMLFGSLAEQKKNKAIAVILSGTGSDGAEGIKAIKAYGGFTIVQEPETAKYDGMPMAALETGKVDLVAAPEKIGEELLELFSTNELTMANEALVTEEERGLNKVFKLLKKRYGTDFGSYKPSTICRRLEKRFVKLKISSIDDYLDYVEHNPKELDQLFNIVLIGVTSFFRDPDAFDTLKEYLQKIADNKPAGEPIRIWVPGCSTGEEAYTYIMLLDQVLGDKLHKHRVQVFATDIDERAIAIARKGIYQRADVQKLPAEILNKYFVEVNNEWEVKKQYRQMVLFSRHDLTNNPPFLKLDLISCRNLLIYFSNDLQRYIIPIFNYALLPNGYLFLGKSESIGQFTNLFTTVNSTYKIFQRKNGVASHHIKFAPFKLPKHTLVTEQRPQIIKSESNITNLVRETLHATFEHPYVVINKAMDVQEIYGDVSLYLGFGEGVMSANILKMAHKELQFAISSAVLKAISESSTAQSKAVTFAFMNKNYKVQIRVKPLLNGGNITELFMVIFEKQEVDSEDEKFKDLPIDSIEEVSKKRIMELEQELAMIKEDLQAYIKQSENANQEFQSLNEELESGNEELQSANEELETTNEELQSTNEEVQVAYAELRAANEQLEKKEALLLESEANIRALINNTLQSFILIDKFYTIVTFNKTAADTFISISGKEIQQGSSIIDYLGSTELEHFHSNFQKALDGERVSGQLEIKTQTGEHSWYMYNYTPVLNAENMVEVVSFSMLDISERQRFKAELIEKENLINSVFNATDVGICVTDSKGRYVKVNHSYCKMYGYTYDELYGQSFTMVVPPEHRKYAQDLHDAFLEGQAEPDSEWKVQCKDGSVIDVFVSATLLQQENGERFKVTTVRNITESKKYKNLLSETQESMKIGGWEYDLLTNELTWTEEVYNIFDLDETYEPTLDSSWKFYDKLARQHLKEATERAIQKGEPYDVEATIITAKGEHKWVRCSCKPVRVYHKTIKLFGTIQDITLRKAADLELEKLSLVASKTSNGVVITDAKGVIEWVNASFTAITGYAASEVIGKPYGLGAAKKESGLDALREHLQSGQPFSDEILIKHKKGYPIWLHIDVTPIFNRKGEVDKYVAIELDITERKKEYEHLKQSGQMYHALASHLPKSVLAGVNFDFAITFISGRDFISSAEAEQKFVGKSILDIVEPNNTRLLTEGIKRSFAGEANALQLRHQEKWYYINIVPMADADGDITGALLLGQEVTEWVETEEKLRKSERHLRESQRIARLGNWEYDFKKERVYLSEEVCRISEAKKSHCETTFEKVAINIHENDRKAFHEKVVRAIQTGRPFNTDIQITTLKGNNRYVQVIGHALFDEHLNTQKLHGTLMDVTARRLAEEQHIESREWFETIFNASRDGLVVELDEKIAYINRAMAYMYGYSSPEELLGRNISVLEHPDYSPQMKEYGKNRLAGKDAPNVYESKGLRKDGSTFDTEVSASVFKVRGKSYIISIVRDNTDRKAAEALIEHRMGMEHLISSISTQFINISTEELDQTINSALSMVGSFSDVDRAYLFMLDDEQLLISNTHEWCNEEIPSYLDNLQNIPIEQFSWMIQRLACYETIHISDVDLLPPQASKEKDEFKREGIKSLILVPVIFNNDMHGFIGFDSVRKYKHWTEEDQALLKVLSEILGNAIFKKRADLVLSQQKEYLRQIIDSDPNAIFVKDAEGRMQLVNKAFLKLIDKPLEDIIGYTDREYMSNPELVKLYDESMHTVLSTMSATTQEESFTDATGVCRRFLTTRSPFFNSNGSVSVLGVAVDITQAKEQEEILKASIREKEVLLKEIHHRVKNNMAVISGLLSLQANYLKDPSLKFLFQESQNRIKSMALIHEKLYQSDTLSRIDFGNYIRDLVNGITVFYKSVKARVQVHIEASSQLIDINMAVPCGLIVNEILSNVYKHAFEGRESGEVRIFFDKEEHGEFKLEISDNGVGIPEDFDAENSTSLGMTLIYALASQLNAEMKLRSEEGTHYLLRFKTKEKKLSSI